MTAIKRRLPPRPCEHSLYKRQPKHMTGASSGFGGPLRVAQTECADLTRMNSKLNFSTPAEGSATYTFDKTAIHFERKPSSYVILNRYIERIARALESHERSPTRDPQPRRRQWTLRGRWIYSASPRQNNSRLFQARISFQQE